MFKALLLEEKDGKVASRVTDLNEDSLPAGEVTVAVEYSTLNYKDGLILGGLGRLVRNYPHVPGVDFAGSVLQSTHTAWKPGDKVILTGFRVGETQWGGYGQKARVKGDWLVALPKGMTTRQAMAIGTAGFTGRAETHDYLKALGAGTIVERAAIEKPPAKPLESERWAACIDAVGG